MLENIEIRRIQPREYYQLSIMVGELLNEIMNKTGSQDFNFNIEETEVRVKKIISEGKYWVFIAENTESKDMVGFVSMYESYALYSEGAYGTVPELYVKENWRSQAIGEKLLMKVSDFAKEKGWHRIEVTTPPLPEFDRTLNFYQDNGFEITGGRKLKIEM